jgi:hypothetical protein
MTHRDVVVTLVHGTFARRAAWLRPEGALVHALTEAGCRVLPFRWSGNNSFRARALAARQLAEHLRESISVHPGAAQWVIAHSHGGNIAVHAVHGAARLEYDASVSIISLATPFIHAKGRRPAPAVWAIVPMAVGVLAFGGLHVLIDPNNFSWTIGAAGSIGFWLNIAIASCVVIHLTLALRWAFTYGLPWRWRVQQEWLRWAHAPVLRNSELLAVRAAGDEASGLMVSGQFLAWMSSRVGDFVFGGFTRLVAICFAFAFIVDLFTFDLEFLVLAVIATLLASVFLLPVIGSLFVLLFGASLAFGWEGPVANLFAVSTAESIPPGDATLIQFGPFRKAGLRGLSHSQLYNDERVIRLVLRRITRSGPQRPDH